FAPFPWVDIPSLRQGTMLRRRSDHGVTKTKSDEEANRRLLSLVGLVVVLGAGCLGWSVLALFRAHASIGIYPPLLAVLVSGAHFSGFHVRVRATLHWFSLMSSAVLVTATILPSWWVAICAAIGAIVVSVAVRLPPVKFLFNLAKDTICALAAAA